MTPRQKELFEYAKIVDRLDNFYAGRDNSICILCRDPDYPDCINDNCPDKKYVEEERAELDAEYGKE